MRGSRAVSPAANLIETPSCLDVPPPGAAGRVRVRRRQERRSSECDEAGQGLGRSSREAGSKTSDIWAAEP